MELKHFKLGHQSRPFTAQAPICTVSGMPSFCAKTGASMTGQSRIGQSIELTTTNNHNAKY